MEHEASRRVRLRFRCGGFTGKKPGNHLTDGAEERNGDGGGSRGRGVGQPRGDIRTLTPVAGVEGWILPCCASARCQPHFLGGVRMGAQCAAVPPPAPAFSPFPFPLFFRSPFSPAYLFPFLFSDLSDASCSLLPVFCHVVCCCHFLTVAAAGGVENLLWGRSRTWLMRDGMK